MIEVFGYALVIGLGLGIGLKTAEGILEAFVLLIAAIVVGPKIERPKQLNTDIGKPSKW